MTISFGGETLLLADPSGTAENYVRLYLSLPTSVINTPPRVISPDAFCRPPNWPHPPALRLNQLYVPTGASRWTRGLFLADNATIEALADVDVGTLVFHNDYPEESLVSLTVGIDPDETTVSWDLGSHYGVRMHKLEPIQVTDTGDDSLWILPLVDERYFWQGKTIVSTAETWTNLASELRTAMAAGTGVAANAFVNLPWGVGDYLDVPLADPLVSVPDPCFFRRGPIEIGAAMDLLCWTLGLRFVPGDLSQSRPGYRLMALTSIGEDVTYPSASEVYLEQLLIAGDEDGPGASAGGDSPDSGSFADIPATVTMRFVDHVSDPVEELYSKDVSNSGDRYGESTMEVWSPAVAEGGGDPPTNAADLDSLAEMWSESALLWMRYGFNWTFNQIPLWRFTGYEDYILLDNSRSAGGYVSALKTRTLPRHVGYDYVPLQIPGYVDRGCIAGPQPYVVTEDFVLPADCPVGQDCGDENCEDYTSGRCKPLKLNSNALLCKCYQPTDNTERVFDLGLFADRPMRNDRVYAIRGRSGRLEVVRRIDMNGFVCCNCTVPCFKATAAFSVTGGSGITCSATIDLLLSQEASDATNGCRWYGADASGVSTGILYTCDMTKADNNWTATITIQCENGAGTAFEPIFEATYTATTEDDDCYPVLLQFESGDADVTWPTEIIFNPTDECDVECTEDPCCCLDLDLSGVGFTWGGGLCSTTTLRMSGWRISCLAPCQWAGLLSCGDFDTIRSIDASLAGDDLTIIVTHGAQVESATYSLATALACTDTSTTATFVSSTGTLNTWPATLPISVVSCTPPSSSSSSSSSSAATGRCCYGLEAPFDCAVNTQAECDALFGTWTEAGNCTGDPCNPSSSSSSSSSPPPTGRCCYGIEPPFTCTVNTQAECNALFGTWTEAGNCTGDPCNPSSSSSSSSSP